MAKSSARLWLLAACLGISLVGCSNPAGPVKLPGKIVFTSERSSPQQIYIMDPDGSNVTALTESAFSAWAPRWSPDGTQIVFTVIRGDGLRLFMMNKDGSQVRPLFHTDIHPAGDQTAEWFPDGQNLLLVSRNRLFTLDLQNLQREAFEPAPGNYFYTDLSTRGDRLAVVSQESWRNPTEIHIYTLPELALVDDFVLEGDANGAPRWSPSGRELAFISKRQDVTRGRPLAQVYVVNANGSDPRQVTDFPNGVDLETSLAWSPDGQHLAFVVEDQASFDNFGNVNLNIYRIKKDGSELTRLTTSKWDDSWPDWSPN